MEEKKTKKNRMVELIRTVRKNPHLASSQLDFPSITEPLAKYISESQFTTIPDDILELAKRHILDTLASMVVSSQLKPSRLVRQFDPNQEKEPRVESALVKVILKNGEHHEIFIEHVLGFPERPMNHQDVENKAKSLITPILVHLKANKLIETIWNLEILSNIQTIIPLLIPPDN
ncbi:MAG: hypothetical protein ACFFAG_13145 [Promethearchaeota archaeon]